MIGDPTEGALVVLGEKGGLDSSATREKYPRIAELPFDTAYKLMATFHRMKDESGRDVVRCFVKGAPDKVLARGSMTLSPDDLHPIAVDDAMRGRYEAENERLGEQGLRVLATARKDFDPATFDPNADLLPLLDGLHAARAHWNRRPAATDGQGCDCERAFRRDPGADDHRRPRRHRGGDRAKLGIKGRAITGAEFGAMSDESCLRRSTRSA